MHRFVLKIYMLLHIAAVYGCDDDRPPSQKVCGRGYGNQPTFVNCADVKIVQKTTQLPLAGFEAPVYQALYASMDGTTNATTKKRPIFTIPPTKEPLVGNNSTTTETPPTKSGSLIGPIIPNPIFPLAPINPNTQQTGLLGGGLLGNNAPAAAAGNNAGNAIQNLFNGVGGTGTAAGNGAGTGTNTGIFGTGNLASLIPLLILLSIFPILTGGIGGRRGGGGGGGGGQRIVITEADPPLAGQGGPFLPGRGGPFLPGRGGPPSRWMPRLGNPVYVPDQHARVSVAAHVSTGHQMRRGYGKSNRYSSYYG